MIAKLLCPSFLFFLYCIWTDLSTPPIYSAVVWMNSSSFSITLGSRWVEKVNCCCVQPLLGTLLGSSGILLISSCAKLCPSIAVYFHHPNNIVVLWIIPSNHPGILNSLFASEKVIWNFVVVFFIWLSTSIHQFSLSTSTHFSPVAISLPPNPRSFLLWGKDT